MSFRIVVVKSFSEYSQRLAEFVGYSKKDQIWYRGESKSDYRLEPSAQRYGSYRVNGKDVEANSVFSAKSQMLHLKNTGKLQNDIDWLSYMQHFGIPTRLLDWSTEFSVPMYFAFEKLIQDNWKVGHYPTIWALKLNLFVKQYGDMLGRRFRSFHFRKKEPALQGFRTAQQCIDAGSFLLANHLESPLKRNRLDKIHVPFVSSFVNERVKMQGGCFIRFPQRDFSNQRAKMTKKALSKLAQRKYIRYRLDTIVDKYDHFDGCLTKFIFIKPKKVLGELSLLNLATSRVYPEEENISLGIKSKFFFDLPHDETIKT